ncbi:MAG: peptidase U32 [Desulfobacteraceae bacterium 4572_130]|nr:MAG: peptidase U32 [Desulfobacteraceae bacterium 4572_130]
MLKNKIPYILAPAGDISSFFAAIAAGADAIYCGFKMFSARVEAKNFTIKELSKLTFFAHSKGVEVYIALNSIIKQSELEKTAQVLNQLIKYVSPDALIIQDIAVINIARKLGFKGEIHISTLANCCFPKGLDWAKKIGAHRVVLPRELNIDEIKIMAEKSPKNLGLEVFIHGALCYSVSGRCYWSSFLGGKSGLRGRCVQPCRRFYRQKQEKQRFFSCIDLSIDVLVKILKQIPRITTWKIEGRKKSAHYVFYTVKGYKMLRDYGHDPGKKKIALVFLEYALGRPLTHYNFLPQRIQNPLKKNMETGSGLFIGRVKLGEKPYLITREVLLKNDLLRIGYQDDKNHTIQKITRSIPKKGRLVIKIKKIQKNAPVFIIDRKEVQVNALIKELALEFEKIKHPIKDFDVIHPDLIKNHVMEKNITKRKFQNKTITKIKLKRDLSSNTCILKEKYFFNTGLWLSKNNIEKFSPKFIKKAWWWLPPIIWPNREIDFYDIIKKAVLKGAKNFVLNIPWQLSFFVTQRNLNIWMGPFCNITNSEVLKFYKKNKVSGAIVSPELSKHDFFLIAENSPIPLGIVIYGNFPIAISRIVSNEIKLNELFTSPMKENFWVTKNNENFWVFPGWELDLTKKEQALKKAGYSVFIFINEILPPGMHMKKRPGLWNWNLEFL